MAAIQIDKKKVKDFVQKNLILVLSYVVVVGCGAGAYVLNGKLGDRIKDKQNALKKNRADLEKYAQKSQGTSRLSSCPACRSMVGPSVVAPHSVTRSAAPLRSAPATA